MRRLFIILGLLVAGQIVWAQDGEKVRERAKVKIEEYKERLELTEAQIAEIKSLREKYAPEVQAIREDESTSKGDKMRAMADIVDQREAEMEAILSEQQMTELKAIQAEVKENMQERRERRRERRKEGQ